LADNSRLIIGSGTIISSKGKPILWRSVGLSNCVGNVINDANVNLLLKKASSPISSTLLGIFNDVNSLFAKALCPILVIELGRLTLIKPLPLKAKLPIDLNPSKSPASKVFFPFHFPPLKNPSAISLVNTSPKTGGSIGGSIGGIGFSGSTTGGFSSLGPQDTIVSGIATTATNPNPNNSLFVLLMRTTFDLLIILY
jgi:hypothetical protein